MAALVNRDAALAEAAGNELADVPFVGISSYSFPGSPLLGEDGEVLENLVCESLSSRKVAPDTPQGTLDAWNSVVWVWLVVVSGSKLCGAWVMLVGGEDFIVCAMTPLECLVTSHRRSGVRVALPANGSEAYAIRVKASSQSVKPKIFSRPTLPLVDLMLALRSRRVEKVLGGLAFPLRVWKLLLEAYPGASQMAANV